MRSGSKLLVLLMLSTVAAVAPAQVKKWFDLKELGDGISSSYADMAVGVDGSVAILGTGGEKNDHWGIAKYSREGTLLWTQTVVGTVADREDQPFSIAMDAAGNVYATGSTAEPSEDENVPFVPYATLVRLDSTTGVEQWRSNVKSDSHGMDVGVNTASEVYLLVNQGNASSFSVHRFTADGNLLNSVENPVSEPAEVPVEMYVERNGGIYIAGYVFSGPKGSTDTFVTLHTKELFTYSTTYIGGSGTDYPAGLTMNSNENELYAVGSTSTPDGHLAYLTRILTGTGDIGWQTTFRGEALSSNANADDVVTDSAGNIYVSATVNNADADACLVSFTPAGIRRWRKDYNLSMNDHGFKLALKGADLFGVGSIQRDNRTQAHVAKIASGTGDLSWSSVIAFGSYQEFHGIAIGLEGDLYLGGITINPEDDHVSIAVIQSLAVSVPATVTGGQNVPVTVSLGSIAHAGGQPISVSFNADGSNAMQVVVPDGLKTATVQLPTPRVAADGKQPVYAGSPGDPKVTAEFTVQAPRPMSLTLSPTTLNGGESAQATLVMTGDPPDEGVMVKLSDNSSAIQTPPLIVVGPEVPFETFPVGTSPVSTTAVRQVYATAYGVTKSASLTLTPPSLLSVTVNPDTIIGGGTATGTVTLKVPAPTGGRVVSLSDNSSFVSTPATVTVPAGASSANFLVGTQEVSVGGLRQVTATLEGQSKVANFTLIPGVNLSSLTLTASSVKGGTPLQGKVTMNKNAPAGGVTIALTDTSSFIITPSSVSVGQGLNEAWFPIDTVPVNATATRHVRATFNGITKIASLTLTP